MGFVNSVPLEASHGSPSTARHAKAMSNEGTTVFSIRQVERIPQQMVAVEATNRGLAFPALTPAFPGRAFQAACYRACQLGAEIKIAANALRVRATKEKQSLGIPQVEGAFEFTVTGLSVRAEISHHSREGLELGKPFSQAARGSDSFLLFLQKFRPDADSLLIHAQKDFV